jgi:hypothetical protein
MGSGQSVRNAGPPQSPQIVEVRSEVQKRQAHGNGEVRGLDRHLELPACHDRDQRPGTGQDEGQRRGRNRVREAVGGRLTELFTQIIDLRDKTLAAPQQQGKYRGKRQIDGRMRRLVGECATHLAPAVA